MKEVIRFTLRLPSELYEKIWKIHSETKESINQIIVNMIDKLLKERN